MLTWSLGWGNVCQVSPLWNYSFPPSMVYTLEAFTMWRSHIRSGELCSTSLVEEYLHKVFEIFLDERFISSMLVYVFNKFCQYWFMNIYFLLWIIIHYYFIYFLTQIILALVTRNPFSWMLCPSDIPPLLWGLVYLLSKSLFSGITRYSRPVLYIFCFSPVYLHNLVENYIHAKSSCKTL